MRLIALFLWTALAAAPPADPMPQAVEGLKALPLAELQSELPEGASGHLAAIHRALAQEACALVGSAPENPDLPALEAALAARLAARGLGPSRAERGPWGLAGLTLARAEGAPPLLVLRAELGLPCGGDAGVGVFGWSGQAWKPLLWTTCALEGDALARRHLLQAVVVRPTQGQTWLLALAWVNPWCTSNWQGMTFLALQPGRSWDRPRTVRQRQDTAYLGVEEPLRLRAGAGRFSLRWTGRHPDPAVLTRERALSFTWDGSQLR